MTLAHYIPSCNATPIVGHATPLNLKEILVRADIGSHKEPGDDFKAGHKKYGKCAVCSFA